MLGAHYYYYSVKIHIIKEFRCSFCMSLSLQFEKPRFHRQENKILRNVYICI
jgi:hypothetical protein